MDPKKQQHLLPSEGRAINSKDCSDEDRYRVPVQSAPDIILTVDRDRIIRSVNPAFFGVFGYEDREVLGRSVRMLHPSEEAFERFGREVYPVIEKHGVWRGELKCVDANGASHLMEIVMSAQKSPDGRTFGYTAVMRDLGEREAYENELRRTRAMLEAAINQSPAAILIADAPGVRIRLANPAVYDIRGGRRENLTNTDMMKRFALWRTLHPDGTPYEPEELPLTRAVLKGETSRDVEVIIRNDSGEEHWVSANAAPITDDEGEIQAGIVIFHDITDRVKAETALRESEERYRTLVEESPLAISLIGKDGRYKYINPQFEKMFGYSIEDVPTGKAWFEKAYPDEDYRNKVLRTWMEDLKQAGIGQARPRVYTVACKDGSRKEIHFRPVAMQNLDQFIIYEDITERKRAEEARVKLENQLRHAQKMEALGTLAGGIAHDFNNILAAILGYTELALLDLPEGFPARPQMEEVLKSGFRAKHLVQQILSFSRKSDPEREPLQVVPILMETLNLLRATLPSTIDIQCDVDGKDGVVLADATQLQQLLMNLCTNAAHAMRNRGGKLKLILDRVDLSEESIADYAELIPGDYIRISVVDTGEGMTRDTLDRVFEPFYTTKKTGEGTGMGLAVVHGIVKAHGGTVAAQSELGRGSTFQVYLPLLETKVEVPDFVEKQPLPHGTEHILYVDDERAVADIGKRLLERLGYKVTCRTSSLEALEVFKSDPDRFQLVITDQTMPGMTGIELTGEILNIRPDLPIIICTGFSDQISSFGTEDLGVRRVLMKPFAAREVAEAVREVLDQA